MALRAVMVLGEQYAPVTAALGAVRHFTASRSLFAQGADAVTGPGSPGSVSAGSKDMESGDRESVTEGGESPKDVAESMKQHDNAGLSDSVEDLKGKPVGKTDKEGVRDDIAGKPM
ncbi:hypothetical protein KC19_4G167300 [Ceratodon purpureus]|uniref:Uncharacterized protein n=1 Tax=Ceratodon purpureus TaxID=3225 RepID=A0A8T0IAB0_CERPU|nr:hypothetical protein KC19_4G167300 [Ceratodon purpureus]